MLGIIVREIDDPFFASLIGELSLQAGALGYQVALGPAHSDPMEALQVAVVLDTRHMDGVIILGDQHDDDNAVLEIFKGHRAVVAMCRGSDPEGISTVNADNCRGIDLLLDHLTRLGHQSLAYIDGGWLGDIRERRDHFQYGLHKRSLELRQDWVQVEANQAEGGYRAMERLLDLPDRPTAVLASDDVMAIGALKAAIDRGISVPSELSLCGFDDIEMARYVHPALTTMRQPVAELSRQALRILVQNIESTTSGPVTGKLVRVLPELVVRQSTGPRSG